MSANKKFQIESEFEGVITILWFKMAVFYSLAFNHANGLLPVTVKTVYRLRLRRNRYCELC
jgi:hypothetical protein